jgi:hypothetical protein
MHKGCIQGEPQTYWQYVNIEESITTIYNSTPMKILVKFMHFLLTSWQVDRKLCNFSIWKHIKYIKGWLLKNAHIKKIYTYLGRINLPITKH